MCIDTGTVVHATEPHGPIALANEHQIQKQKAFKCLHIVSVEENRESINTMCQSFKRYEELTPKILSHTEEKMVNLTSYKLTSELDRSEIQIHLL